MEQAVEKARKAWQAAPLHVRAMAGQYVDPLIVAILEIAAEVKKLKEAK